jgi:hypothetical protein
MQWQTLAGMATIPDHQTTERRMRELLACEGLPQPDDVHYEEDCVVMRWYEQKLVVEIDLREESVRRLSDDEAQPSGSPQRNPART